MYTASGITTASTDGGNTVQTPPFNTTPYNLIVVMASFVSGTAPLTDSLGNTWTVISSFGSAQTIVLYYCYNPITGSNHTFKLTGSTVVYPVIGVIFAQGAVPSPLEGQTGLVSTGTSIQPGSVTPAENGDLIVSALAGFLASGMVIDSGFSSSAKTVVGGQNYSAAIGWLSQSTAAPVNPTWSWDGSSQGALASSIAVFKNGTYTLTAPGTPTGTPGTASGNFTVTPGTAITGTITPHDGGMGGTFTPSSLSWVASASAETFTYTPATTGSIAISTTNSVSFNDPSSVAFTSYGITITPSSQSVGNSVAASLIPLLLGGSGSLTASTTGGTLSTTTPTSGTPFTLTTQATGIGSDVVTVSGPGGSLAMTTISFPISTIARYIGLMNSGMGT